jgi:hypothetical protein
MLSRLPRLPLMADLFAGWRAFQHHPVGIGLPVVGALLVDALTAAAMAWLWQGGAGWPGLVLGGCGLAVLRAAVQGVLRARWLAAGAAAMGHPLPARTAPVIGVHLVTLVAQAGAVVVVLLPMGAVGVGLLYAGWYSLGSGVVAAGVSLATLASFAVRVALATAAIEAALRGASGLGAVRNAMGWARSNPLSTLGLVLSGDSLILTGSLFCGAGAIPGYPMTDLALLRRIIDAE